jgi:exopolysaccharide production protein ExoQ
VQKLERIVVFLLLLLATGAGQAFIADPDTLSSGSGQPVTQVVFGLIYLVLILFLVKYRTAALSLLLREKWLAALCIWALASVAWSVEPGESLRRSLALVGTTIAGLYLAVRFEPKQQLKMIAWVIGLGAIASLVVVLALPSIGFMPDGSMQGVYNLKNSLGRIMSLGAFCFALLALGERRHRAVRIVMFLLCCALLVLSKSATAVVVTMLMLALLPLRKLIYLRARGLLAAAAILVPVMAAATFWAVEYSEDIFQVLGRTSSLSGRIPLWQLVMKSIDDRPIRGYGFTAFWSSWEGHRVSDTVNWDAAVPHAHNGFLEVWLGLGLIGLALMLINLSRNFLLALRVARSHREIEYSWPLLLVVFTVLYNVTENSLLAVNAIPWIAYGAVNYWLSRATHEEAIEHETEREAEPAYSA